VIYWIWVCNSVFSWFTFSRPKSFWSLKRLWFELENAIRRNQRMNCLSSTSVLGGLPCKRK